MNEPAPQPQPEGDPLGDPLPPYAPPRGELNSPQDRWAFLRRPGPALGVGVGGCFGYLVLAHLVPGILIGIYLAVSGALKGGVNPEAAMIPYLWVLTGFGVLVSIAIVVLSRTIGWLDEGPRGASALWAKIAWPIGLALICPFGSEAITWVQTKLLNIPMQEQALIVNAAKSGGIGFWFAIVIGAPLGEELFFRRWFYGLLRQPIGRVWAFLLTGLCFAVIHFNFPAMLAYVWIAACCTLAYERSGSIWGAIGVHFVNNLTAAIMLHQAAGS